MNNIQRELIIAHHTKNVNNIKQIYVGLLNDRAKMDRWFNKYLDMFDEKFADMDWKDPARKLYNSKFEEYQKLSSTIKMAEHYLKS